MAQNKIKNVFVLMLENRSFDHMLGYSGIRGKKAGDLGTTVSVEGVIGRESQCKNTFNGQDYTVSKGAKFNMKYDPNHEFKDVVEQLSQTTWQHGQTYPPINNGGFVSNYNKIAHGDNLQDVMRCYAPEQLPVMNALAKEFAVCDHWFSSIPGPTWPNRFFAMGASSCGWDASPGTGAMSYYEYINGLEYDHGSIFDNIDNHTLMGSRIYHDTTTGTTTGTTPISGAIKHIHDWMLLGLDRFASDLQKDIYPYNFTFIEPSYGDVGKFDSHNFTIETTYKNGSSQHPMDDVRHGEKLIKFVYETIRNSKHWEDSLLIITYDEHGGFYDHVAPPATFPPGDSVANSQRGFKFDRLGVRVPALVISPYIPQNVVDQRQYEHSSISKTLCEIFGMPTLTARDAAANSVHTLLSLDQPRSNCPTSLPNVAGDSEDLMQGTENFVIPEGIKVTQPLPSSGNLHGFLQIRLKQQLSFSKTTEHQSIIDTFKNIETYGDAHDFMQNFETKLQQHKVELQAAIEERNQQEQQARAAGKS